MRAHASAGKYEAAFEYGLWERLCNPRSAFCFRCQMRAHASAGKYEAAFESEQTWAHASAGKYEAAFESEQNPHTIRQSATRHA